MTQLSRYRTSAAAAGRRHLEGGLSVLQAMPAAGGGALVCGLVALAVEQEWRSSVGLGVLAFVLLLGLFTSSEVRLGLLVASLTSNALFFFTLPGGSFLGLLAAFAGRDHRRLISALGYRRLVVACAALGVFVAVTHTRFGIQLAGGAVLFAYATVLGDLFDGRRLASLIGGATAITAAVYLASGDAGYYIVDSGGVERVWRRLPAGLDANAAAVLLVLGAAYAIRNAARSRSSRSGSFLSKTVGWTAAAALIIAATLLTGSRTVLLATLGFASFAVVRRLVTSDAPPRHRLTVAIISVAAVATAAAVLVVSRLIERLPTLGSTLELRLEIWRYWLAEWVSTASSILIGFGSATPRTADFQFGPHNTPLEVLVAGGVIGAVAIGVFLTVVLRGNVPTLVAAPVVGLAAAIVAVSSLMVGMADTYIPWVALSIVVGTVEAGRKSMGPGPATGPVADEVESGER